MGRFCYVYHICREVDKFDFSKGYIGISKKPSKRWGSGYRENPHLKNAFKNYNDIIKYVFYFGTVNECLHFESKLRPSENIGWNIAKGGGKPPEPKKGVWTGGKRKDYTSSEETRIKQSKAQQKLKQFNSDRMKGSNNPMFNVTGKDRPNFKGFYKIPIGIFEKREDAAKALGVSTMVITRRCVTDNQRPLKKCRWVKDEEVGKTWNELGYSFIDK